MADHVSMFVNLKAAKTHIHKQTLKHTHTHTQMLTLYSMIQNFGHLTPYFKITLCYKIDIIVIITIIVVNLPYT
jgi:hypothetical protein